MTLSTKELSGFMLKTLVLIVVIRFLFILLTKHMQA